MKEIKINKSICVVRNLVPSEQGGREIPIQTVILSISRLVLNKRKSFKTKKKVEERYLNISEFQNQP